MGIERDRFMPFLKPSADNGGGGNGTDSPHDDPDDERDWNMSVQETTDHLEEIGLTGDEIPTTAST